MAIHPSIVRNIPWTEELGGLLSMGVTESDMTEHAQIHFSLIIP